MLYEVIIGFGSSVPTMTVYTNAPDTATAIKNALSTDLPGERISNIEITELLNARIM